MCCCHDQYIFLRKEKFCIILLLQITALSSGGLKMKWFDGKIIGGIRCVTKLSPSLGELNYAICYWKWNIFFSSDSLAASSVTWDFVHLFLLHLEVFHFCRIVECSCVLSGALECTEAVQRSIQTFLTSRKVLFAQFVPLPSLLSPSVCLSFPEGWERHINALTQWEKPS